MNRFSPVLPLPLVRGPGEAGGGVELPGAAGASPTLPAYGQARTVSTGSLVAVGDVARVARCQVRRDPR
jgi:hypothetical protein